MLLGAAAGGIYTLALVLIGQHFRGPDLVTANACVGLLWGVGSLLGPLLIRRLTAMQIGQAIREDGPAGHATKAGTPTMGGVLIIFSLVLATLLLADLGNWYVWMALLVTVAHGAIGFLDDFAKVFQPSKAEVA